MYYLDERDEDYYIRALHKEPLSRREPSWTPSWSWSAHVEAKRKEERRKSTQRSSAQRWRATQRWLSWVKERAQPRPTCPGCGRVCARVEDLARHRRAKTH